MFKFPTGDWVTAISSFRSFSSHPPGKLGHYRFLPMSSPIHLFTIQPAIQSYTI